MNKNTAEKPRRSRASEQRGGKATPVIKSSGDIFADLGVELDAKDRIKNAIAREIASLIEARRLTQKEAAEILQTDQARVSNITRGRLAGLSVDRLINFLITLGYDVDIHLSESSSHRGNVTVHSPCAAFG